jgi:Cu/Ag efflux pump CusA
MRRYVPIKFSVRGRNLGSTVTEARARIVQNVKLPSGYRIIWAGEFEDLQTAKARLAIFVPLSLGLILILLYSLFYSLRDSLLALAGIPFAIGGGVLTRHRQSGAAPARDRGRGRHVLRSDHAAGGSAGAAADIPEEREARW